MRKFVVVMLAFGFVLATGILIAQQAAALSLWAYGFDTQSTVGICGGRS